MSKLTIEIRQIDGQPHIYPSYIIKKMNGRFSNQEQFEQQIDVICLDIAADISKVLELCTVHNLYRCQFYHHTGLVLFDCTALK